MARRINKKTETKVFICKCMVCLVSLAAGEVYSDKNVGTACKSCKAYLDDHS